ncbi:hypothetical protein K3495_g4972 [Podosphaera aphanis]|nr:hypothetical protein K3495_g4972 [Podosphaera aphanis]
MCGWLLDLEDEEYEENGELEDREDEECEEIGELEDGEDEECEDEDDLDDSDDETSKTDTCDIMSAVESLQDILREQKGMGNTKFLEEIMASNVPIETLLREIQERKRRRTMSKTWSSYKHPATMYYR